jgi:hypothetical protein
MARRRDLIAFVATRLPISVIPTDIAHRPTLPDENEFV